MVWTVPEKEPGGGTGSMYYEFRTVPPDANTEDCGDLRCTVEIINVIPELDVVEVDFVIGASEHMIGKAKVGEDGIPAHYIWTCPLGEIMFSWRLYFPDTIETYETGDRWFFYQDLQ